jgi:heme/copper-type cytochrome/quinol oxidase subunit 3
MTNEKIKQKIGFIGFILMMIGAFVLIFLLFFIEKNPVHYGECYDKFGNEILGQTCLVKESMSLSKSIPQFVVILTMVLIIVGGALKFFIGGD